MYMEEYLGQLMELCHEGGNPSQTRQMHYFLLDTPSVLICIFLSAQSENGDECLRFLMYVSIPGPVRVTRRL